VMLRFKVVRREDGRLGLHAARMAAALAAAAATAATSMARAARGDGGGEERRAGSVAVGAADRGCILACRLLIPAVTTAGGGLSV